MKPQRYTFDADRMSRVADGQAVVTFARLHKGAHSRLGHELELGALPVAGPFHKGRCTYRARAVFDEAGLVRVFGPDGIGADPGFAPAGDATRKVFYAAERGGTNTDAARDTLARRAGFRDWPAAWAHIQTLGRKAHGRVMVEVIGWVPA